MSLFGCRALVIVGLLTSHVSLILARLPRIHVDPSTGHFMDSHGRVVLFRGINSVIKHFPWYDPAMLDPYRHAELAQSGFNVVRLGAMWTGVEPIEGQINQTYIDVLKEIVVSLEFVGIYTILDMHQDVLWKTQKTGDGYYGIPPWIQEKLNHTSDFPWPFETLSAWPCGYFTKEINKGFDQFYRNVENTTDSFVSFWETMATNFKDLPGVLGYELINEPWGGDAYSDASLLLPGVSGRRYLAPLYNRVSEAIRAIDDQTLIFWNPPFTSNLVPFSVPTYFDNLMENYFAKHSLADFMKLGSPCGNLDLGFQKEKDIPKSMSALDTVFEVLSKVLSFQMVSAASQALLYDWFEEVGANAELPAFGFGMRHVPGGPEFLNRTVMSWHYYCLAIFDNPSSQGPYPPILQRLCDKTLGPKHFEAIREQAKLLGGSGTMLTEFGLCTPNITDPTTQSFMECNFVMESMETYLESWIFWDTSHEHDPVFWDLEGNFLEDRVALFARPYPRSVAGVPYHLAFNITTRELVFEFFPLNDSTLQTELVVPSIQYPNGSFEVNVSEDLRWTLSASTVPSVLSVAGTNDSAPNVKSFVKIKPTK